MSALISSEDRVQISDSFGFTFIEGDDDVGGFDMLTYYLVILLHHHHHHHRQLLCICVFQPREQLNSDTRMKYLLDVCR